MPWVASVSPEEFIQVLSKLDIFFGGGMLKKEKDDVWKEAYVQLGGKTSIHNLYIRVLSRRSNIVNILRYIKFGHPQKYAKFVNHLEANEENSVNNKDDDRIDEYDILHSMVFGVQYHSIIRSLAPRRFHLIYWLPEQMDLYKDIINALNPPVSLLAISNLTNNVTMKNYTSSNIFLFILAVKVKNKTGLDKTINLAQALSKKMELHFIIHFCHEYLKNSVPVPEKLVIGYSKILLNGASFVFNNCYFNAYNLQCYRYLLEEVLTLPTILLHVDTLSLLKVVDELHCFINKLEDVKYFYLQCIIYLSTVRSLDEFKSSVVNILIMVLSPYSNEFTEKSKLHLDDKIKGRHVQEISKARKKFAAQKDCDNLFSYLNVQENIVNAVSTVLSDFVQGLKSKAIKTFKPLKSTLKSKVNAYYSPMWFKTNVSGTKLK